MRPIPFLQSEYWNSPQALESAKNIVSAKIRNMNALLKSYLSYRQVKYPNQAQVILALIQKINRLKESAMSSHYRSELMLLEARTAKTYWQGFALLSRAPAGWKRFYPHAKDARNLALNIGYTMLARTIRPILDQVGFSSEIGIYHSPENGQEALLYDFEELLRQPIVDAPITALFSRVEETRLNQGILTNKLLISFAKPRRYAGEWIKLTTLIENELYSLRRAMIEKKPFVPFEFSWSHWSKSPKTKPH